MFKKQLNKQKTTTNTTSWSILSSFWCLAVVCLSFFLPVGTCWQGSSHFSCCTTARRTQSQSQWGSGGTSTGWQCPIQTLQGELAWVFWQEEMRLPEGKLLLQVECKTQYFLILGMLGTEVMKIKDNQLFSREMGTKIILMENLFIKPFPPWECWHLNAFWKQRKMLKSFSAARQEHCISDLSQELPEQVGLTC